jgi:hypothetical protein
VTQDQHLTRQTSGGIITRHGSGYASGQPIVLPDDVRGRWLPSWLLRSLWPNLPPDQYIGWDE